MKTSSNTAAVDEQKRAAEEARQKEAARQARLDEGTERINAAFSDGGWQDKMFNNYKQAHSDYYQPQVEEQFAGAKKDLTYSLARSGMTRSSVANNELSDLFRQKTEQDASILSQADQGAASLKEQIAQSKQNSINQLYATEDPDIGANAALDNIRTIQSQAPPLQPLGTLFQVAQIGANNYDNAQYNRRYNNIVTGGSGNSSYVVR
jgi:hypothetical protein